MFVGAINATVRKFLANSASAFNGKNVIVGCSGNFTSEAVISQYAKPKAIHSNDIAFYSCMMGRWLTDRPLEFKIVDEEYDWLQPYFADDTQKMAAVMVLLDMLDFEAQNNQHKKRMWNLYRQSFSELVDKTAARLVTAREEMKVSSFFAGDVFGHFERFADDPDAVFCCYAPTYAGGYERLYKKLDKIVSWDEPEYQLLDDERRDLLLNWMGERCFLWYDDRQIGEMKPVMEQRSGIKKTIYLHSNAINAPAYFGDMETEGLPNLPLIDSYSEIAGTSGVSLLKIKTTDLARFKDAFLSKAIDFASGMWAFAVMLDEICIGFLEFSKSRYTPGEAYMLADFPIPGTKYKRLSKLIVMLAKSKDTRRILERRMQVRTRSFSTTAFTERPVSMKYRGVLKLVKRGQSEGGQKFINYGAKFNNLTWQETLQEWLTKHGSITY